jgi:hypothetical protein
MFGSVSISGAYTPEAISLLVYFYANYFGVKHKSVMHINPYIMSSSHRVMCEEIFCKDDYEQDMVVLKANLQQRGFAIPTLYKQYADLCEAGGVKFMDFGVDTEFQNAIDGFIVVDIYKLKASNRKRYLEA